MSYTYEFGKFCVSERMKTDFDDNGYVVIRNLLCADEVKKIEETIFEGGLLKHGYKVSDDTDRPTIIILWQNPGDDVTGMMARSEKLVTTAEKLLGVEELYLFHGKCLLKEPIHGGSVLWHQDYGYWYHDTCLRPDMIAVFVAIDECTQENGGLMVLRGSHKCGRIDHQLHGPEAERVVHGPEAERVELLKKSYDLVHIDLNPGDAIFFHCNLLHKSGHNNSKKRRLAINASFNEENNRPVNSSTYVDHKKIKKVPDTAIIECKNYTDFSGRNFMYRGDRIPEDFADKTQNCTSVKESVHGNVFKCKVGYRTK
ncbi:L-proline trans-4-hydroxylase-like [Mercenaria mercenaria]|uniref:L-proline trans-4-hydroxylase-like n=1 Tax=Mercenaria mercenaria TaxID=6596 RepID=UPI00234ECEDB|nr:L-proline trans-4-hydroxylase-like [Mercenaria mercenaria]